MPFNIFQGNSAEFIVEFLDSNGLLTIPGGGILTVTYTKGITTGSAALALAQVGSFFTATWGSSVADLGQASWSITATGSSVVVSTGVLRIIE